MNKRQSKKQVRQQAATTELKQTVKELIEARNTIEQVQHDINRFVNQMRVQMLCYKELLNDNYKWREWSKERPTKSGLYIVYTKRGNYGLIRINEKCPQIIFDQHEKQISEAGIYYWRPLAELANWQKMIVDKERLRNDKGSHSK